MANVLVNEKTLKAIADAVNRIPSGGSSADMSLPGRFFDYEGALLHSFLLEELAGMEHLPELPFHEGLVCTGWNWSLEVWCDTCVSAVGIRAGCSDLIGRECGVEEHVKIFKKMGIWIEDGTITPEPGYVIVYNWDKAAQPNDGYSDHIGFVEKVSGGMVTAIEGNRGEKVDRRVLPLGWGYIRGYAAPRYEKAANETGGNTGTGKKSVEAVAKEVLAGKWGNGEDRKKRLQAAGYDYGVVQAKVNELVKGSGKKSVDAVAKEVIAGKWGNGANRKKKLQAAGYDYGAVQKRVNEMLKK